jgi:hypothetical protein
MTPLLQESFVYPKMQNPGVEEQIQRTLKRNLAVLHLITGLGHLKEVADKILAFARNL